ncbi:acyltransferase family protein [Sporolactobacillus laevolacticus]|uniref:Acyltransferase 3 domain-containing protein n=1 Tax=Sporolactobacillus laevolacticus DSM 442 TaxID=1395513 RepID=V6J0U1_9BACL|nr:acyltransferase [Sporolactobacillus laevolacticus]EST12766.1 hypothetical protein P343_05915 [Sporolactobacillus laevolacticus DSM 442]
MRRYEELDALRGIASLEVVLSHCLLVYPIFLAIFYHAPLKENWQIILLAKTPLHSLFGGNEAVILFFVLSGFVLSLLYLKKSPNYIEYIVRRICRIYLPYIFSIVLSLFLLESFNWTAKPNLSEWFNQMWHYVPSVKRAFSYVIMLGIDTQNVNTVTWSLVHEMRISFVFPLIMLLVKKYNWKKSLVIGLAISLSGWQIIDKFSNLTTGNLLFTMQNIALTFYYVSFFIMGAILAKYRTSLALIYYKMNIFVKWLVVIFAVIFYNLEWMLPKIGYLKYYSSFLVESLAKSVIDFSITVAVCTLIIFALNSKRLRAILKIKPLLFLGKISYSLYLIHPIVLLLFVHLLYGLIPLPLILISIPITAISIATIMHRLIEVPSIQLGKLLSRKKINSVGNEI